MSILAVAVHDAEGPQAGHLALKVLQYTITVLVDFALLWDKPSARVYADFLDDVTDNKIAIFF